MSKHFFSILIPVYNVEKYLPACIESVLQQSFTDYEVILVDDGSKDRSGQICDEYRSKYPEKFFVEHKPNQGLISARRAGLNLASGRYVCFLDSDDCWMKFTLSRLYEILQTTDSDVVFFRMRRMDESGNVLKEPIPGAFSQTGEIDKAAIFERMLSTSLLNSLCAKCCRLELFDREKDYSCYYNMKNGEDMLQSLPVLSRANSFYYLDEELYQYRMNSSSITHNYQDGQYRTLEVLLPTLYDYIVELGLDTPQNTVRFFGRYLAMVWDNLVAVFENIPLESERSKILAEMRNYEFVIRSKEYLQDAKLHYLKKKGLFLFFAGKNLQLGVLMKTVLFIRRMKP